MTDIFTMQWDLDDVLYRDDRLTEEQAKKILGVLRDHDGLHEMLRESVSFAIDDAVEAELAKGAAK